MSTSVSQASSVNPNTLITVKVLYNDNTRRFKIPLKELEARVLPQKLRQLLGIPRDVNVTLERLSDSAGCYIHLDSENNAVYKQLYRAAKAKLKLRIKVTEVDSSASRSPLPAEDPSEHQDQVRYSYLQTVLSSPLPEGSAEAVSESPRDVAKHTPTELEAKQWSNTGVVAPEPHYQDFSLSQDNLSTPVVSHKSPTGVFCIDCNHCGLSIPNEHYHCSICDDGDYDLCLHCVDSGVTCPNEDHWLIRRIVKDGIVTNSTTETVAPRKLQTDVPKEAPEKVEKKLEFVPEPVSEETPKTSPVAVEAPVHSEARICNACLKECRRCASQVPHLPDWDYCSECFSNAADTHPGHRFAPLYEAISEQSQDHEVHYGIFCDGPLCKNKAVPGYITGVRYKCSVCYDLDFCASCEALPTNTHNRTHPMVMLKTPVRNVTVPIDPNPQFSGARSSNSNVPIKEESGLSQDSESVKQERSLSREQPVKAEKSTNNAVSGYDALFVRDTVPDSTIMSPNKVFRQNWTLYNPGPLAWPAGSDVRFVGGDSMFNVDTNHPLSLDSISAAMESNKLTEPLESGQSAEFTVTLKAPSRVGTAISYWRLKLPNGMPFGHRLWCEIQVREGAPSIKGPSSLEPVEKHGSECTESQMIFPKLEKESPDASAHEAGVVAPVAPSISNPSEQDVLEDVESLSLGDHETENGFLTDEEYDILDASDQEYMDAKSRE
ncbi:hypothetical protein AARAC_008811 [Aspergillus arachidicola]|uniref:ZZ-type domain-containing protein n=1 Tax=Aspergillus arachidicola TaxID=656916 RepID=A0A2G7G0B3_9EURO|nr:hypothetical protein AARAC_008811 [Aspergillus arachidicola]